MLGRQLLASCRRPRCRLLGHCSQVSGCATQDRFQSPAEETVQRIHVPQQDGLLAGGLESRTIPEDVVSSGTITRIPDPQIDHRLFLTRTGGDPGLQLLMGDEGIHGLLPLAPVAHGVELPEPLLRLFDLLCQSPQVVGSTGQPPGSDRIQKEGGMGIGQGFPEESQIGQAKALLPGYLLKSGLARHQVSPVSQGRRQVGLRQRMTLLVGKSAVEGSEPIQNLIGPVPRRGLRRKADPVWKEHHVGRDNLGRIHVFLQKRR